MTCQAVYLNLLLLPAVPEVTSTRWLREVERETARCDCEYSFTALRQEYRDHAGDDAINRVLGFTATGRDLERVDQAVLHHFEEHRRQLAAALTWRNYVYYQLQRLVIGGGCGWQLVRRRLAEQAH